MAKGEYRPADAQRASLGAVAALLIVLLTGCPSSGVEGPSREAAIYRVVIAHVADDYAPEPVEPDENPVLYVESFVSGGVSLQDQVELVAAFIDDYEVRFVDDRDEAVDDDLENRPVRPGGALLGLGAIVDNGVSSVRVELYADESDITAYRFSVRDSADSGWEIVGEPESVLPEGFVAP